MYRLFAALPVPEEFHPGLVETQTGLSGASWRPAKNFHITLRFFGDVSHASARDLDELLAEISCPPFEVSLEGMGWFGRREPTAVWARVRESDALRALSAQCERAARRLGLEPDRRPFTPHVTLAYLHGTPLDETRAWVERHHAYRSGPFWAEGFHLYSSHSGKGPSRYVAEADYVLE
ncbi:RNA 2',3'-cyclic phosphodiesterase [uncultured Hyphomonas sp.]|jgi:2'-5' RNA ligase|uniref:RNA 2',3'-cyclic phosphodiesterase n=1 Tax=uncultured Hyphomonas sp. TaxID=225298 RepID=UPI000C38E8AF|nr:RNA 2',3'-cyclic phosphodiesterase [Hyphomonadaceae bacterium]MBA27334.1 RNA 2',3'-cyclic phosphodiesterase [Hyphomonadaceae bacterium]|tara:strand:+ start:53437 stop:53970 length:534 start_codon:yes stop_codon:yes gene_type:complete